MRTEKFNALFKFARKSNLKAGEGLNEGAFPFFTSSSVLRKRVDKAQYFDEALIFGTGGSASVHFAVEPFSTSTDCIVVTRKDDIINTKYVYYYLIGNIHVLERGFKGAGLKHISKSYIENIDIPILPIETQNKIVVVLDRASILLKKKDESIGLLDQLLRATFLEMFGDPVLNPKKWPISKLSNVGKFISGGTPSKENINNWTGNFPWISPKDMKSDYIHDSIDHISEHVFSESSLKRINAGSILIVVRGMILAHSFPVAINKEVVAINQDMKAIIPSKSYKSEFLLTCLKIMKDWILQYVSAAGHGTKKMNSDSFTKISLPQPPIEDQEAFVKVSAKLNQIKEKLKSEHIRTDNLLKSILQKVPSGQIEFNMDFELEVLLRQINLLEKRNDLSKIENDTNYLKKLIEKLNAQEFREKDLYDKAKYVAFQIMADRERAKIIQYFDENSNRVKLIVA